MTHSERDISFVLTTLYFLILGMIHTHTHPQISMSVTKKEMHSSVTLMQIVQTLREAMCASVTMDTLVMGSHAQVSNTCSSVPS